MDEKTKQDLVHVRAKEAIKFEYLQKKLKLENDYLNREHVRKMQRLNRMHDIAKAGGVPARGDD